MRRLAKATGSGSAPPRLLVFKGSTTREKFAWLKTRDAWWDAQHDPEDPGGLQWLFDGYEQTGSEFAWCGTDGPCDDNDCLCAVWPDDLESSGAPHEHLQQRPGE